MKAMKITHNQRIIKDNRAFTLIEMIIGLAIASMVTLAVYSFMSVGTRSYEAANQKTKVQKEMQLANNYIEDVVITGSVEETKYIDHGDVRMLYTGDKILYYDKSTNQFAVYNEESDINNDDIEDHLITNCMTEFKVEFLDTEFETTTSEDESESEEESEDESTILPEEDENTIHASSNMVKITTAYVVKNQKLNSEKIYMIRNK
ncbi:MAG: prepilin-type N-terminal cleavage/methylation domain-containing protein [Lachnospiraceae bacterium]|nr:prepilin-type N-terminal cleavage/methylation domain-containing protein [Lachnospiraceae bacterium]